MKMKKRNNPPVLRERTAVWNSKGIVLTLSKGKINNSLDCHKKNYAHKTVLFFFFVFAPESANLPTSLCITFISLLLLLHTPVQKLPRCIKSDLMKRILKNLNITLCLCSVSQHCKWWKIEYKERKEGEILYVLIKEAKNRRSYV